MQFDKTRMPYSRNSDRNSTQYCTRVIFVCLKLSCAQLQWRIYKVKFGMHAPSQTNFLHFNAV